MIEFKPEPVSQEAWDKARSFLSRNFTVPIGNDLAKVLHLSTAICHLESYDYKMVTWEEFVSDETINPALVERAKQWHDNGWGTAKDTSDFVIYDPLDDEQGYLLVGNDPIALIDEAVAFIIDCEPVEGPLSKDYVAMSQVEGGL